MNTTQGKNWLDELTLELRLRGVSGDRIGDTLATVKEFLADSGEEPQDAFGTPSEYAANLHLPRDHAASSLQAVVTRSAIGVIAFLAFTHAAWAWAARETLDVGMVQLAWLAVPVLAIICLPLFLDVLLRRIWLFITLTAACVASGLFAAFSTPQTPGAAWFSVDPILVLAVTGTIMIATSVVNTVTAVRDDEKDRIREPLDDPATERKQRAATRLVSVAGAWLFPMFSLASLCLALLNT